MDAFHELAREDAFVKESLCLFLQSLNPDDIVAVVAYNDDAQIVLPAQKVSEGYEIAAVIDRLQPTASTNLHAGLMLGFQEDVEVLRNVTIEETAEGLKEIARLYGEARYQEAWTLALRIEQDLRRVANLTHEEQMYRDAELLRKYGDTLARWVERQAGRRPDALPPTTIPERAGESEAYDSPLADATAPVLDVE